ncbi:hypothetical protein [Salinimicrobium soli]|uniref:hypothetical protein n=1 Tax=Salinimicrobium soli TaxID=1254399 RepID=UPI003AB01A30
MEKKPSSFLFSVGRLICYFFGHHLQVTHKITDHIFEYRCTRCALEMTDTTQGTLARLTPRFKETNELVAKIYRRKCSRKVLSKAS